jgi:hypothetical protein
MVEDDEDDDKEKTQTLTVKRVQYWLANNALPSQLNEN